MTRLAGDRAELSVPPGLLGAAQSCGKELEAIFQRIMGRSVSVAFSAEGARESAAESSAPAKAPMSEHPLVKQAIEVFGGRLVSVSARKKPAE